MLAIEEHGVVGDLRTVALVGTDGSIDLPVCPSSTPPPCSRRLLDRQRRRRRAQHHSGRPGSTPDRAAVPARHQHPADPLPGAEAVGEVIDFMVPATSASGRAGTCSSGRRGRSAAGPPSSWPATRPSTTAGPRTRCELVDGVGAVFESTLGALRAAHQRAAQGRGVAASPRPSPWRRARASTSSWSGTARCGRWPRARPAELFATHVGLLAGAGSASPATAGRWREMVQRSALALKLLTYAADRRDRRRADHRPAREHRRRPQLGLPLHLDPRRRVHRCTRCCGSASARRPRVHGLGRGALPRPRPGARRCTIMYARRRQRRPARERSSTTSRATAARGRCASATAPCGQLQLDIYGELMDSVYLYNTRGADLLRPVDRRCASGCDWLAEHWEEPDEGIWEVRGGRAALHLLAR